MTFTQNLARLDFNVTAIEQTGSDGVGPAYLVNGLTAAGYWYQVGLSWKWPSNNGATLPGFSMNYEVFGPVRNACGGSIYPANCAGGGVESITVNSGDLVLLSLFFSNGNVIMRAMDWNTHSSANQTYTAKGQTQFIGLTRTLAQNGFFTGLMTEQYHTSQYYGSGVPVRYSTSASLVSAWLWMDEGDTSLGSILFSDNTTTPVQLNDSTGAYFASNGTAEVANSHGLVTGITPAVFPTVSSGSATGYSNQQARVSIQITNSGDSTVNLLNVTIVAYFSTYHVSSPGPFTLHGTTAYNLTVSLPPSLSVGNYTLHIDVSSWQYQEPQSQEWIQLHPASFNETLRVTSAPPPPPTPTPGTPGTPGQGLPGPGAIKAQSSSSLISQLWAARAVILLAVIGYLALVSFAAIVAVRHEQTPHSKRPTLTSTTCQVCGYPIVLGSAACLNCGKPTTPLEPY